MPAGHRLQADSPVCGAYVPSAHSWQLEAPCDEKVPIWQGVQAGAPASDQVPAGHASHAPERVREKDPGGQERHEALPATAAKPAAQAVHATCPSPAAIPAAHVCGSRGDPGHAFPAGQDMQAAADTLAAANDIVPGRHAVQVAEVPSCQELRGHVPQAAPPELPEPAAQTLSQSAAPAPLKAPAGQGEHVTTGRR